MWNIFLNYSPFYAFEQGLLLNLEFTHLAGLATHQVPGVLLSSHPQCWDYRQKAAASAFSRKSWGTNTGPPLCMLSTSLFSQSPSPPH